MLHHSSNRAAHQQKNLEKYCYPFLPFTLNFCWSIKIQLIQIQVILLVHLGCYSKKVKTGGLKQQIFTSHTMFPQK